MKQPQKQKPPSRFSPKSQNWTEDIHRKTQEWTPVKLSQFSLMEKDPALRTYFEPYHRYLSPPCDKDPPSDGTHYVFGCYFSAFQWHNSIVRLLVCPQDPFLQSNPKKHKTLGYILVPLLKISKGIFKFNSIFNFREPLSVIAEGVG